MLRTVTLVLALVAGQSLAAVNGRVFEQHLDSNRAGYTVMKVWGTPYEMGFAQGSMLAGDIRTSVQTVKTLVGTLYPALREQVAKTEWSPQWSYEDLEAELEGMAAGIASVEPAQAPDVLDLKVVNIYGDWSYACRSHSSWGQFVGGATKTISVRRLEFSSIGAVTGHHVLLARDPGAGGMRWVNLSFPGAVSSVTGVNEYGTLASIHDYQSQVTWGAHVPRSLLPRLALTLPVGRPVNRHLDAVYAALQGSSVMTGTFLNYMVPQGKGGVITCPTGKACSKKRVPQSDFFDGEVLLTTNDETDGHSAPSDDSFMHQYFEAGGPKTLEQAYDLMGHTGLHLLALDFRSRGSMTMWFEGRLGDGTTFPPVKTEWSTLFDEQSVDAGVRPPVDAGVSSSKDAGVVQPPGDAQPPGRSRDAGHIDVEVRSSTVTPEPQGRSSCSAAPGVSLLALVWLAGAWRRRIRQTR